MDISKLPKNREIILLASLRKLKISLDLDYASLTRKLINEVYEKLCPINIHVPTFNYDFLNKGIYNYYNSESQVGRFSEEFRREYKMNRNYDPVFSYTSMLNENINDKKWCKKAFERNSFFEKIDKINFLVINIDLPSFKSTFVHYLENKYKVPYRYDKKFKGIITTKNTNFDFIYKYYVRNLNINSSYNGNKLGHYLKEKSILKNSSIFNANIQWYNSDELIFHFSSVIKKNINFFID